MSNEKISTYRYLKDAFLDYRCNQNDFTDSTSKLITYRDLIRRKDIQADGDKPFVTICQILRWGGVLTNSLASWHAFSVASIAPPCQPRSPGASPKAWGAGGNAVCGGIACLSESTATIRIEPREYQTGQSDQLAVNGSHYQLGKAVSRSWRAECRQCPGKTL